MTNIEWILVNILVTCIIFIVLIFISQTVVFINLKSHHDTWKPIYENRKEHFDKYLKYAINNRQENETLENIALLAAIMKCDSIQDIEENRKDFYINFFKDEYLHELRSAGLE